MTHFDKPAETNETLLDKLIERGLVVPDRERALRYLQFIGYYRFGGYRRYFEYPGANDHRIMPGVAFDDILDLYIFDRKLRNHVFYAIEKIEVAIRASLFDCFALEHGTFWYTDYSNFKSSKSFAQFLVEIARKVDENKGIQPYKHFIELYEDMEFLPSWVISDLVTFSSLSRVYNSIKDTSIKKAVAKKFDLPESVLGSWMHFLTYIRNICAHHSMLWNKLLIITPSKLSRLNNVLVQTNKFYTVAVIIQDFLQTITRHSQWSSGLYDLLLNDCPIDHYSMGFPQKWWENSFWRL